MSTMTETWTRREVASAEPAASSRLREVPSWSRRLSILAVPIGLAVGLGLPAAAPLAAVVPAVLAAVLLTGQARPGSNGVPVSTRVLPAAVTASALGVHLAAAPAADVLPMAVATMVAGFVARVNGSHLGAVVGAVVVWWLVSW